jgi:hypothetical protein
MGNWSIEPSFGCGKSEDIVSQGQGRQAPVAGCGLRSTNGTAEFRKIFRPWCLSAARHGWPIAHIEIRSGRSIGSNPRISFSICAGSLGLNLVGRSLVFVACTYDDIFDVLQLPGELAFSIGELPRDIPESAFDRREGIDDVRVKGR